MSRSDNVRNIAMQRMEERLSAVTPEDWPWFRGHVRRADDIDEDSVPNWPDYDTRLLFRGTQLEFPQLQQSVRTAIASGARDATVFVGDSILNNLQYSPANGWYQLVAAGLTPVNLAVSGDSIQNAMYRYDLVTNLGLLSQITPRLFVVLLGTNNYKFPTARRFNQSLQAEILSEALTHLADMIHRDFPRAAVVLMGLSLRHIPNLDRLDNVRRNTLTRLVNQQLKKQFTLTTASEEVAISRDCPGSTYLDVASSLSEFASADNLLPDGLHPSSLGYQSWVVDGGLVQRLTSIRDRCIKDAAEI